MNDRSLGLVLLVGLGVAALASCAHEPAPPHVIYQPVVTVEPVDPRARANLDALDLTPPVHAHLEKMDPSIQAQIQDQRRILDELLDKPGVTAGELSEAYGKTGMLYLTYDFEAAAEVAFENARTLLPQDPRWDYYLSRIYRILGDLDDAAGCLERVLAIRPDDVAALFWLAEVYRVQDRLDEAEHLFHAALTQDPSCVAARFGLGQVALSRGEFERAVRIFEAALESGRQEETIHYGLGMAYRGSGDLEKAKEHLSKSSPGIVRPPDPLDDEMRRLRVWPNPVIARGKQLLAAGEYSGAVQTFRAVLAKAPEHEGARVNLAVALMEMGDLDGASREFSRVLSRSPDHATARYNFGVLHVRRGAFTEAIDQFLQALESNPDDAETRFQLSCALVRAGRDDEALEQFSATIDLNPAIVEAHLLRGLTLIRMARYEEARARLEETLTLFPDYRPAEDDLARLLATCPADSVRDGRRALEIMNLARERGKMSVAQVQTLAMAYAEVGEFKEAVRWQERALTAATDLGRADLLPFLKDNLARYERREPCGEPWLGSDPLLDALDALSRPTR